jgi:CDP-diglyceride synthetase
MFLAAFALGKRMKGRALAVQLNLIQSMIGMVSGIAFMVVILAAFFYIKRAHGARHRVSPDVVADVCSGSWCRPNLGVFMGVVPRSAMLKRPQAPVAHLPRHPLHRANPHRPERHREHPRAP